MPMTGGEWCARCRHYIVPDRHRHGTWVHYSDDDWSHPPVPDLPDCECAYMLLPCTPPKLTRSARYATGGGEYAAEPWSDPWNPGDGFRRA